MAAMGPNDPGTEMKPPHGVPEVEISRNVPTDTKNDEPGTSHHWFASTACPLLAATLGPIASGFNICALVSVWRNVVFPGTAEEFGIDIPDPPWLLTINAVSLLAAIIANGALLLNMGRRLKFSTAQPITISGFVLAGVLLMACTITLTSSSTLFIRGEYADPTRHVLSSAFYYAIFAIVLYFIVGLLMVITVHGAKKGYYGNDFQLTASQRTLMVQTMVFVAYLLLGALTFSKVEGWTFLQAVYFTDVTLLTIGLGDFAPGTQLGRGLFIPFAVTGILIVGLVVGSIRSLVLERARLNIATQITEKRRSDAIQDVDAHKHTIKVSYFTSATFSTDESLSPAQRREKEFNIMRKVQNAAERDRQYLSLAISLTIAMILWFLGAAIFMVAERHGQGWSYFSSLYFTYVCLLTIGYGDLTPKSNAGRAFFVMWSILAVPALTILISDLSEIFLRVFSATTVKLGEITMLSGEHGLVAKMKHSLLPSKHADLDSKHADPEVRVENARHLDGTNKIKPLDCVEHHLQLMQFVADRLANNFTVEELEECVEAEKQDTSMDKDVHFYHYVLSRECRQLQKDLTISPTRKYSWHDWEYYLKLTGSVDHSAITVTTPIGTAQHDGVVDRATERKNRLKWHQHHHFLPRALTHPFDHLVSHQRRRLRQATNLDLQDWSWLSDRSPLASACTETEWLLERLSLALLKELNAMRKGMPLVPAVMMRDMMASSMVVTGDSSVLRRESRVEDRGPTPRPGGRV